VADAMLTWHNTAMMQASNLVTPTAAATGCFFGGTGCLGVGGTFATVSTGSGGSSAPECSGSQLPPCWTPLPAGYQSVYTFNSAVYEAAGIYYVLTYVPPPVVGNDDYHLGLVCLPGVTGAAACPAGDQLSLTYNQLYNQIQKKVGVSSLTYGTINGANQLVTSTVNFDNGSATPVPQAVTLPVPASVPVNSIGIIGSFTPCSSC
jgi:hypothetical protein